MSAVLDDKMKKKQTSQEKKPKAVVPGLGEALKRARATKGFSLRDLGRETGMSASRICQLEAGDGNAKLINFVKLAQKLGRTASELLDPQVDERVQFMQLAHEVKHAIGTEEMRWLAALDSLEAREAMDYAHAGVNRHREKLQREAPPAPGEIHPMKRGEPS